MHEIDLSRVDLNLLVVFEALMETRHVGRAAARLCLSQSATSHALGRLRQLFDDPLFVRHPRGIEPTPKARDLAQPLGEALARLREVLGPTAPFDPATLRRTFTLAAHDYALATLMPSLMADLRVQAPNVELRCVVTHPAKVIDSLDRGELDAALGGFVGISAERIARTTLFTDRFVGVARKGHPRLRKGRMSLDDFVALPHAVVSAGGEPHSDVDRALDALGLKRQVAIAAPNFLALPLVIEHTDIIGVLPARLASRAAGLTAFELPLQIDPVSCNLLAPAPLMAQPAMRWLTALLLKAASSPSFQSMG